MHHALLITAPLEKRDAVVTDVLSLLHLPEEEKPDVRSFVYDTLHVDDVRTINEHIRATPLSGALTVTFLCARDIGNSAQQALLKITEEPPAHARIVLVVPNTDILLPTLRSRFITVDIFRNKASLSHAETFVSKSIPARQKVVQKIAKDKDIFSARKLVGELIEYLATHNYFKTENERATFLHRIMTYNQFLQEPGVSMKMILEDLAITTPQPKH